MKKYEINENYFYLEFSKDIEMFEYLDQVLHEGFVISDSIYLCVEVTKNGLYYLLSYLEIPLIDKNIKQTILSLFKEKELVYPQYENNFLSVISAIRHNFNYPWKYDKDETIFDKKYKKVIILLLDGLGVNILNKNLDAKAFLKKHFFKEIQSIYPSTTAAATTAIKSGLSPMVTGWTGWENYVKEINRNVVLFTGKNYYTEEDTGISLYSYIPYSMFYEDMKVKGYCIEPDFTIGNKKIDDVLNRSLKINAKEEAQIQYVYFTEPDGIMHEFGAYSKQAKEICKDIDDKVKEYANHLTKDTLLIITADHGHTDVKDIRFYGCKPLLKLLKRKPSNDSRCITFCVKEDKCLEFENLFHALFGSIYKLYKTKDAIAEGFFGNKNDIAHARCKDFLADYVAVATNIYYFNYKSPDNFIFKSHHAGITKEEMMVPICLVRK